MCKEKILWQFENSKIHKDFYVKLLWLSGKRCFPWHTNFSKFWWPMQPQLLKYGAKTLQVTNFIMLFQFQPKSFFPKKVDFVFAAS